MSKSAGSFSKVPLPTTPENLFEVLKQLEISYDLYRHKAVFTVAESAALDAEFPGVACRNLYLRDKKKKNFLIVAANETQVDLKTLQVRLSCARLSFGSPQRLWEFLGIRPGSVCPFTVINDPDHHVKVVLDAQMMKAETVNYHPLDNTMTIGLSPSDLLKFFVHTGHQPITLDL